MWCLVHNACSLVEDTKGRWELTVQSKSTPVGKVLSAIVMQREMEKSVQTMGKDLCENL